MASKSEQEETSDGFLPFFTPNKRSTPKVLDHVEPGGTFSFLKLFLVMVVLISRISDSRPRQIWVSAGCYLQIIISSHQHSRFIPEFISRLPSITTLSPLTPQDLRKVLTEVRGSLISQYTALFGYSGVEIRFSSSALDEICHKAAERGGGARGLRGIMVSQQFTPLEDIF